MVKAEIPTRSETDSKITVSSFFFFRCCGASPVLDLDEAEAASADPTVGLTSGGRRSRSREQEKKLKKKEKGIGRSTGDADTDSTTAPKSRLSPEAAASGDLATRKKEVIRKSERKSFFHEFSMERSNIEDKPPTTRVQNISVHHITSKSKAQHGPVPLYRVHKWTRIGTLNSHPGSSESHHKKSPLKPTDNSDRDSDSDSDPKSDFIYGLSFVALILGLLLFSGRTFTIICMCNWFYLLPRIRSSQDAIDTRAGRIRYADRPVDTSSEEYKKMVVLKGLLERDGGRTLRSNVTS